MTRSRRAPAFPSCSRPFPIPSHEIWRLGPPPAKPTTAGRCCGSGRGENPMVNQTIVLVGVPDTGKTNFLARLWEALRGGNGTLMCPIPPDNIKYVEDALGH